MYVIYVCMVPVTNFNVETDYESVRMYSITRVRQHTVFLLVLLILRVYLFFFSGSIDVTPDGMKAIVTLSSGDMRRSLNILQVGLEADHAHCVLKLLFSLKFYSA